jgi:hypothetical protein
MYRRIKEHLQEPEQTPFPDRRESEESATENQKRVRDWLNEWDYKESKSPKLPELINIEFSRLALQFRAQAKGDSKLAHKMAWEWLEGGFDYFPPPDLPLGVMRARLQRYAHEDDAESRAWKLNIKPLILLSDACEASWCRHKTLNRLTLLLKRVGFPEPYFWLGPGGCITESAYEIALQKDRKRRQELNTARKRQERKKRTLEEPTKPFQQRNKRNSS